MIHGGSKLFFGIPSDQRLTTKFRDRQRAGGVLWGGVTRDAAVHVDSAWGERKTWAVLILLVQTMIHRRQAEERQWKGLWSAVESPKG